MQDIENQINRGGQNRIVEIDLLRGFTIILMILGHSFIVHPIDIHSIPWCVALHNWIYSFHMELFFLLSGCVYKCSCFKRYIVKKTDRILVPYIFWGLITLLLHSSGSGLVNRSYSLEEGFISLIFYGGSYWFLYTLFTVFMIYPLLEKIFTRPWMELSAVVVLLIAIEYVKIPEFFTLNYVFYYLPYFVLGRYLVRLLQSERTKSHFVNAFLLIVSLGIYIAAGQILKNNSSMVVLTYLRAVAMIFVVYVPMHYLTRYWEKGFNFPGILVRFLNNCSKYSLQLYIFNGFILVAIRTFIVSILQIHNSVVIVSSIVAGNLIVTLLICNYLLPKSRWLSWLCGIGNRPWVKG